MQAYIFSGNSVAILSIQQKLKTATFSIQQTIWLNTQMSLLVRTFILQVWASILQRANVPLTGPSMPPQLDSVPKI